MEDIHLLPVAFYNHLPHVWTFMLLVVRYSAVLMLMPGLSGGPRGLTVRIPGILAFSYVSLMGGTIAELPANEVLMIAAMTSEFLFGFLLGFTPAMVSTGVQMAAQLSTGTMGLGAAQLMDPNLGVQVPSLGRIMNELVVCLFLVFGGHYAIMYVAAGLGGIIVPGTFVIEAHSIEMIIQQTGNVFVMGVMLSAPVIVALLLTQFVMGLISKAVPSVNIFIVSFPLTIGIGLLITIVSLPEVVVYAEREFLKVEKQVLSIAESTTQKQAPVLPDKALTQVGR
jgi:flagellar biosynthetic protein FliR